MKKIIFLALAAIALALAQNAVPVDKMIDDGRFQAAYAEGIKQGGAKALALAAKAASFYAVYEAKDIEKGSWFDKAEDAAKKAIQADKDYAEGYFELARAHGRLAQYRGILESLSLATSVRENLEKTLALNDKHAGARVALALWNIELNSKGVGWLYGANNGRVVPLFEEAIKLEPQVIIHKVEYATALERLGKKDEARKQLEAALAIAPKTAADRYDQERARKQLAGLK